MRANDFVDYYAILGIAPGASAEDVREAWRRCARMYHPDLNPRKTSFRFQRAKEAYDILSDPAKRRQYDREFRLRSALGGTGVGRRSSSPPRSPSGFRNPRPPRTTGPGASRPPGPTRSGASRPPSSGPKTPPEGAKTPPGPAGGKTASAGASAPPSARPPGARGAPPGSTSVPRGGDVRTRTTFRPATVVKEERASGMVDALKDVITRGGVSRVTIRAHGRIIWERHITSALIDDLARLFLSPLTAAIRLLGADERVQVEITNELQEDYNRANSFYDEGKLEDAKSLYKRCIDRDRYFADAHLSLGAVYEAQGDVQVAIECYRNAVKIDPTGEAGKYARENLRRLRGY